ncbi:GNAT family N-acetyltransferase [Bacillus carboniphilus]|uniref:GNAT family N-acetyltransferase n=1 Tax=Bacillus carboniphilus TaxID=86663 RepID=A0ABY9JUK8_9BACI|nr:GNAT family N-acetyltransferase [Bacillus carboniphilus]WLR43075.1 GNAT family N-acetyltransferase [Bacillus carboniphilus]
MQLIKPMIEVKEAYLDFYHEWMESGEKIVPWSVSEDPSNFNTLLDFFKKQELKEHTSSSFVPNSTFLLVNDEGKIVAAANIRHRLNDKLKTKGGHIGYGVRPLERGNGYASKILALSLEKAKEMDIKRVLVTCDEKKLASKKTIEKNGGNLESRYTEENGNVVMRFWIEQ